MINRFILEIRYTTIRYVIKTDIRDYRRATVALGIIALVLFLGLLVIGEMAMDTEKSTDEISTDCDMVNALGVAQGTIQEDLSGIDSIVTTGAIGIGRSGPDGDQAIGILSGMSSSGPAAIDAITADLNGTIVAIRPDRYKSVIGANIYNQTHIRRLYEQRVPVMSDLFMTVEGFPAVDIASPVFSPGGKFIGITTLLISPGSLLERDLTKQEGEVPWDTWVVQRDGTLLYSSDGEPAGKNIVNDPGLMKYPELAHLSGTITTEWQGTMTDTFTDVPGNTVTKHIVWTTVGIRGTEWRLVFSRAIANPPEITDI
ncbi:MAG TPA: hypothetical protein VMS89_05745 [Methanoregulaceae archaeon]|nr:hypothetical protein [Methanoregulaceae archaeon]